MPLKFKEGEPFPDSELTDESGNRISISELANNSPLLIAFHRGYW